jgi:hypothetical protein
MTIKTYGYTALTDGVAGSLDFQDGSLVQIGDRALVIVGGKYSIYQYIEDATKTNSPPDYIKPLNNAYDKVWELQSSISSEKLIAALTPADIGASAASHTHTFSDVNAAPANHTHTLIALGAEPAFGKNSAFNKEFATLQEGRDGASAELVMSPIAVIAAIEQYLLDNPIKSGVDIGYVYFISSN